ncbi:MAG: polysaccharide biosynthesis/export family protein [Myxococcaceae bacterium]
MRPSFSSLFLLALSLGACRGPRPLPTASEIASPDGREVGKPKLRHSSTLGPGDLIEVKVFQEPDLSGPLRLSPDGTVDYPLCGKVLMTGRTQSEAADMLTQCLSKGFLKRPQVSVLIREYNSKKVFVFGEVQKPGTFPYDGEISIIQAVTLAGGFTKTASKNGTNVTRIIAGQEQKIRVPVEDIGVGREPNFTLLPGDIVFVPESFF